MFVNIFLILDTYLVLKNQEMREFVRYEEVIDFAEQFGKDQQCSGFYDAYLRMPTEEEGLEEAMKYIDKNMPPCTAFLEGIKYA